MVALRESIWLLVCGTPWVIANPSTSISTINLKFLMPMTGQCSSSPRCWWTRAWRTLKDRKLVHFRADEGSGDYLWSQCQVKGELRQQIPKIKTGFSLTKLQSMRFLLYVPSELACYRQVSLILKHNSLGIQLYRAHDLTARMIMATSAWASPWKSYRCFEYRRNPANSRLQKQLKHICVQPLLVSNDFAAKWKSLRKSILWKQSITASSWVSWLSEEIVCRR